MEMDKKKTTKNTAGNRKSAARAHQESENLMTHVAHPSHYLGGRLMSNVDEHEK